MLFSNAFFWLKQEKFTQKNNISVLKFSSEDNSLLKLLARSIKYIPLDSTLPSSKITI